LPPPAWELVLLPLLPIIEPLLVILMVVPEPQPVLVYIAAVPDDVEPTVTPELIVSITGVFKSPPAEDTADAIL
jgi:hypothetical protein